MLSCVAPVGRQLNSMRQETRNEHSTSARAASRARLSSDARSLLRLFAAPLAILSTINIVPAQTPRPARAAQARKPPAATAAARVVPEETLLRIVSAED